MWHDCWLLVAGCVLLQTPRQRVVLLVPGAALHLAAMWHGSSPTPDP
jgi:hypothetical protein